MYRIDLRIRGDNLRMARIPFTIFGRYQSHAINYDDKIYHLSKELEGKHDVSSQAY